MVSNSNSSLKIKNVISYLSKILSTSLIVILVLIGIFLVYYFFSAQKSKSDPSYSAPVNLYTIVSGSMEPNIKVYDVVLDLKVDKPEDIKVNDVITFISTSFISEGLIVTHRVVDINVVDGVYYYTTKGDANGIEDSSPVTFGNVVGKVSFRIPQLGRIQEFVSSGIGWLLIVLLPALGVIVYDVVKLLKLLKTKSSTDMLASDNNSIVVTGDINVDNTLEKIKKSDYLEKLNELKKRNLETNSSSDKIN